jgi:hypothetical protein
MVHLRMHDHDGDRMDAQDIELPFLIQPRLRLPILVQPLVVIIIIGAVVWIDRDDNTKQPRNNIQSILRSKKGEFLTNTSFQWPS